MNFELTPDQTMLADSVDRFGRQGWPVAERPRLLAAHGRGAGDRWPAMAELGWLMLPLSEAQGGLGGTPSDVMVVAEGLGRHLVPEPFVSAAVLAASLLPVDHRLLAEAMAGTVRLALALGDGDGGFIHAHVATTAVPSATGAVLTGSKAYVADGADADWFIVPGRRHGDVAALDGIGLYLVARDAPGLVVERFRGIDNHRYARLRLDRVAGELLAEDGGMALALAVKRAVIAHCAEAVGAMDALQAITLDYLKTRKQFGAAIGTFQALQHRMVDIAIACEEARSITYRATLELEAGVLDRGRMASTAKARVGQCALFVGRQAVQLHGGVGTSDELVVSHYLKRLMMLDLAYGNAAHHLARLAAL